ncbi:MAG TPA: inositol monophosphatase family protein [Candidatus Dormibacteraeota bacterium]|nr:inositol monophosphatase family protein [Candidatus Dormibacteraeota bacterium]
MRTASELQTLALAAAQAAGDVIRAARRDAAPLQAELKGAGDYVTVVDRAAEAAAVALLREADPSIDVLAEERGGEVTERMWVIDPLDGTTNFLRGFPEVGVSIALVEEGVPSIGVVTAPLTGGEWSAIAGRGAFDAAGRRLDISRSAGAGVVATGFPFRCPPNLSRYVPVMTAAMEAFEDLRRAGAASLDLAYTAAGVWDGFFELNLALWDIAAGSLLVREAGGVVSDWQGDERAVFASGDILAGAPAWHERMLALVRAAA